MLYIAAMSQKLHDVQGLPNGPDHKAIITPKNLTEKSDSLNDVFQKGHSKRNQQYPFIRKDNVDV